MSTTQQLQIKIEEVESFKRGSKHRSELVEHGASAFMTYFEEVSQAFTEKGVEATTPVLAKLKRALIPLKSTPQEAPRPSLNVAQVSEAEAQVPIEERVPIDDPI